MPRFPARLHVLLARNARIGLVIRRGPSDRVATLLWNLATDEFELGQWLKGRIYERRSDLSPDGKYFIYFAMNGHWESESKGSWTAISRTPYLRAITFLPKGDCWNGGGLFTGADKYWLNEGHNPHVMETMSEEVIADDQWKPDGFYGGECPGVYFPRLLRDGWMLKPPSGPRNRREPISFEKVAPDGWLLRKLAHAGARPSAGKGCYWDEHVLVNPRSGEEIAYPNWEWADIDRNRLVWASEGRLEAGRVTREGLKDQKVLYDFNEMDFQAIEAPY